jgi:hypothetical protein
VDRIDPDRLADALRVLEESERLPAEHPDAIAVRRGVSRLFKAVKKQRQSDRRAAIAANDAAVTAATATGAPGRIDDETRGLALAPSATGSTAGKLLKPRACYVCKQRFVDVDAFYHQLCPPCAARNHERRDARTDLSGRRALLTGGRAKIGMYIALRLLRDGAHTTITTRFPTDAVRRFTAMPDSAQWLHRLTVVGLDLRDPAQVIALADRVAARGPLDVLINNAAQTVRRTPGSYAQLVAAERAALPPGPRPEVVDLGTGPVQLTGGPDEHHSFDAHNLTALALTSGSASLDRVAAGTAIDAGGLAPDLHRTTAGARSSTRSIRWSCSRSSSATRPRRSSSSAGFRPALAALARGAPTSSTSRRWRASSAAATRARPSPHEHGQGRAQHAHADKRDRAADGRHPDDQRRHGWITDERPHPTKMRLAEEGLPRAARPRSTARPRLRPDRPRRGGRGRARRASSRTTSRRPGRARRGRGFERFARALPGLASTAGRAAKCFLARDRDPDFVDLDRAAAPTAAESVPEPSFVTPRRAEGGECCEIGVAAR